MTDLRAALVDWFVRPLGFLTFRLWWPLRIQWFAMLAFLVWLVVR